MPGVQQAVAEHDVTGAPDRWQGSEQAAGQGVNIAGLVVTSVAVT